MPPVFPSTIGVEIACVTGWGLATILFIMLARLQFYRWAFAILAPVMGQYAQQYHFDSDSSSLTELVKSWQDYWPAMIPLPHPSPRNNRWLKMNPWFETEVLPELKTRIKQVLKGQIDE